MDQPIQLVFTLESSQRRVLSPEDEVEVAGLTPSRPVRTWSSLATSHRYLWIEESAPAMCVFGWNS